MKMQPSDSAGSAKSSKTIWVFTPSRTDPKDLEFILVQRQNLLRDAVERVRESALTDHKHHLLFVGPRGCGKTHLATLIVSRLAEDETLTDHLRIAWLNEDETCTTLLEFLLKIHAALEKRYPAEFREDMLSAAYEMKPNAALEFVSKHLLSALGSRTLLVVTENLDAIFEGLGASGQKQLRSFIQENPRLSIVATAQRLVEDLSNRNSPFFGFFQTEHLKPLTVEQATELLQNIARLQDKTAVVEFLSTSRGRSRVRAIHHLSGGNHRIYIVLSQFITRDSVDALLEPFMKMVDELTPYYQERIRWLPPLQRKIVEYLCTCEGTVPVKEIAKRLFATPQTISSQLQDLREKGYVEANQRGRESLYEISEPLMRICVEVKDNQRLQPLRLLVDFLRVWYDDQDLKLRLGKVEPASASCAYLRSAIQRNSAEGNLRKKLFLDDLQRSLPTKMKESERLRLLQDLMKQPEVVALSVNHWHGGNKSEAVRCLDEALSEETTPTAKAEILMSRASLHSALNEQNKEIVDYTAVITLSGAPTELVSKALVNRGITHRQGNENELAIADFTAVIGLDGAPIELVAEALIHRGIAHGEVGDSEREIADYTAAIKLPAVPIEKVAEALLYRGITYGEGIETEFAIADFTAIISLDGVPVKLVVDALFHRGIVYGEAGNSEREIADYTEVINMPGAPIKKVAEALLYRGITHGEGMETELAIADFTAVISLDGAPAELVADGLFHRGISHGKVGDSEREIADYTAVINLPGAPIKNVAEALLYRGITHGEGMETELAIADLTGVLGLEGLPIELVAEALLNRGLAHGQAGDSQRQIADYTAVIDLTGTPIKQVAEAFLNRGIAHGQVGDSQREIADYTAVIDLTGTPTEQVVKALVNRGVTYGQAGDSQRAIADYTVVINLPGATIEQVARALVGRGVSYGQIGDSQREIADYTAVIGLPGAPLEKVAMALCFRGITHGDVQLKIADYTAVIDLPGAPIQQVAMALYSRGVTHFQKGCKAESRLDFEALIRLPEAPVETIVDAHLALSELHFSEGRWSEGFQSLEASLERAKMAHPPYYGKAADLIGVVFSAGLSPEGRRDKVAELFRRYQMHEALPVLGEAVIQHIGSIYRSGESFPSSDNLEGWKLVWEQASENIPDFRLSLRLLSTSISFFKAGGKDRTILLALTSAERSIVEQAMGLTADSP